MVERLCYFVGTAFGQEDQSERFLRQNCWELGWKGQEENKQYIKMKKLYDQMKVGDYIALKATYTKSLHLPFANPKEEKVSTMKIKALGKIREKIDDGHTVLVDWDRNFEEREWYFSTYQQTIWQVKDQSPVKKALLDFVLDNKGQDYNWFLAQDKWSKYCGK